jgi:acetylglutamate kinase
MRALIKIGGALLEEPAGRRRLAAEIGAAARGGVQIVVVHGGGRQITRLLAERGVESRFINGLRVTTPEVLEALLQAVAGTVNQELVAAFIAEGAAAVGLSGMDGLLTEAEPLAAELGAVGRPVRSNAGLLDILVANGYLPVVACLAGDRAGRFYNVNADQMAVACATAFRADKLVFLTDVEGVRDAANMILPEVDERVCRRLIEDGVATGGMRAKLEAALLAVRDGVGETVIGPGARPGILEKLLGGARAGTRLARA